MKKTKKYAGVIVPMVSPVNEDLSIDRASTHKLVKHILEAGACPFVLGTTGEASSLSLSQKKALVKETVAEVGGKTLVYAGISSNCLQESKELAQSFSGLGVDVLVTNLPSYYPLNEALVLKYCEQLADACPKPLFLYNIPATTNYSIPINILEKLSYHPNIVGIKDSERNQERLCQSIELWKDRDDFSHLLGWAAMSSFALKLGSDGIVPSTGNFEPNLYVQLYKSILRGECFQAEELQKITNELSALYQRGRNLSESLRALKLMLSTRGLCGHTNAPPNLQDGPPG